MKKILKNNIFSQIHGGNMYILCNHNSDCLNNFAGHLLIFLRSKSIFVKKKKQDFVSNKYRFNIILL